MTKEQEAFEAWLKSVPMPIDSFDVWQAGCKWQRERDADICEGKAKRIFPDADLNTVYMSGVLRCADAIRSQE